MTTGPLSDRESVLANAIGWVFYSGDGRPVDTLNGVPSIVLSEEESLLTQRAAVAGLADLRAFDRAPELREVVRGRATGR